MSNELKPEAASRYQSIIASIANNAISKIEGISLDVGLVKYKFGLSTLKDRNVMVYIEGDSVIIDMYVNVAFGYSVPEVVCALQEKIKTEVERNTRFEVKKINVHVTNIVFD
jgi:Uncharacterized protein conserved in bacteria